MLTRRKFVHSTVYQAVAGMFFTAIQIPDVTAGTTKGVSYGPNKLDIYPAQPNGSVETRTGGYPIVIFVHGGEWRKGDRSRVGLKAGYFTTSGYVFVSVGYTLYPRANAMVQAAQVGQAVNWVRANARQFNGNPNRLALMGHSAGCHLSALATFTGAAKGVRALICNDTRAYDLSLLAKVNNGRIPSLYSALRDRKNWRKWSPVSYVGRKRQPPTLVAWSNGSDRKALSLNFASSLRRTGNPVELFDGSSRYSHLTINSRIGAENENITAVVTNFIKKRIG